MGNIDLQTLFTSLKDEVSALAISSLKQYKNEATADGLKLLDTLKTDIENWKNELLKGEISVEDLEFLVLGKKELIEMNTLKQVGLAKIKIDEFKNNILKLIANKLAGIL